MLLFVARMPFVRRFLMSCKAIPVHILHSIYFLLREAVLHEVLSQLVEIID